ncbi:hypothetical protein GCM10009828_095020 [Actinoplanes couchii]|uniref:Metallo-beta-lactamase domain-containing protein n=1 Tax=Actinoplanes couchii TaxID=403638 RepID=A0ABQ3XSN6_9ACTN|nr:hypothetical protein Aco03nite_099310 [Actinoplanes couchii]
MTVDVQSLTDGLWRVPTSASNAYLWRTRAGGFVVVDPGLYGDETIVQNALRSLEASTGDVQSIVVTYFHSDHAGAAAALAAVTGAPVGASFRDAAVLRGDAPHPRPASADPPRRIETPDRRPRSRSAPARRRPPGPGRTRRTARGLGTAVATRPARRSSAVGPGRELRLIRRGSPGQPSVP